MSHSRSGGNDVTTAIRKFQKFFGLPVTGKLDQATMKVMSKPRCGLPDVVSKDEGKRMKRFSTWGKWRKTDLKYYVSYGADLPPSTQDRIFANAFTFWSDAAPKLRFERVYRLKDADLRIRFCLPSITGRLISHKKFRVNTDVLYTNLP